jgi:hypothetical protein
VVTFGIATVWRLIELPLIEARGQGGRQLPEMHNAKMRQPSFRWQRRSDESLSETVDPLFSEAEHEFAHLFSC